MALIVVPCSDAANGFGDKVCVAEDVHLEQSQDQHADLCTPFCVCNCCGISITVLQITKLLPQKIVVFFLRRITTTPFSPLPESGSPPK